MSCSIEVVQGYSYPVNTNCDSSWCHDQLSLITFTQQNIVCCTMWVTAFSRISHMHYNIKTKHCPTHGRKMCWNEFVEEIVSPWDLIIMTPKIVTTLWPQNFIITTQCWTAILWNSHYAKNTWWPQNLSQWIWDIQLPGVQGKIKGGLRAVIYGQGHGKHKLRLWWWEPIPCHQLEKAFYFFSGVQQCRTTLLWLRQAYWTYGWSANNSLHKLW